MSERTLNRDPKTGKYLTKLTPTTRERILEALASGVPPEVAAAYAGVVKRTYQMWMAEGRAAIANANGDLADVLEQNELAQFAIEVEEALARFIVGSSAHIAAAGTERNEGEWQALAWQLERRFPHWFGRKTQTQVTGTVHHEHSVVLAIPKGAWERLPIDKRMALSEMLAEIEGEIVEHPDEETSTLLALNP